MGATEWREVELGDVIELHDSKRKPLSGKERSVRQGRYPYYGASGIIDHLDDYMLDGSYLLISEDGENLNSRKLPIAFWARGKFWVNNHAHIILGKQGKANTDFVRHWLLQANISGYITGAAQPKLSQGNLCRIKLDIPKIETQNKIANVLSCYDNLIENNNRRIAILEEMAQSLYREWFVKFRFPGHEDCRFKGSPLGQIPEGWEVVSLDKISKNFDRKRKPLSKMQRAKRQGIYPYYGAAKIFDYIDDFIFDGLYLLLAEDGSVITPERNPVLQLVDDKFWPNNHTHILQATNGFSTQFLYTALARVDVSPFVTGAAQPKINQTNMNRIQVIKANPHIQNMANEVCINIYAEYFALIKKNNNLKKQRDMLLPKLISGKIEIKG